MPAEKLRLNKEFDDYIKEVIQNHYADPESFEDQLLDRDIFPTLLEGWQIRLFDCEGLGEPSLLEQILSDKRSFHFTATPYGKYLFNLVKRECAGMNILVGIGGYRSRDKWERLGGVFADESKELHGSIRIWYCANDSLISYAKQRGASITIDKKIADFIRTASEI